MLTDKPTYLPTYLHTAMGPLTWVGCAEVYPTTIRGKAMSLSTSANRLVGGIITSSTLSMIELIGVSGLFGLLSVLTVLSWFYLHTFFPETKGM